MIVFRFSISASRIVVDSWKHFVKLLGILLARALQIFHRGLQREQRIFQFVRQPPRHFAPRRHSLGLHQAVALLGKLLGHLIERLRQLANLISAAHVHARVPVSARHFARAFRQLAHRPRHARRTPPSQQRSEQESDCHNTKRKAT